MRKAAVQRIRTLEDLRAVSSAECSRGLTELSLPGAPMIGIYRAKTGTGKRGRVSGPTASNVSTPRESPSAQVQITRLVYFYRVESSAGSIAGSFAVLKSSRSARHCGGPSPARGGGAILARNES